MSSCTHTGEYTLLTSDYRYVGTTYWAYISNEINELNQLLRDQTRSLSAEDTVKTPSQTTQRQIPPSSQRDEALQKLVLFPSAGVDEKKAMFYHVPVKRQSDILYQGFMSGVHAISPVVHPPTILQSYNRFWDWFAGSSSSDMPCPEPSFIALLYAIWYGGSVTISIRTIQADFGVASRSELSKVYSEEATRWLTMISFPRSPSLQGLAAYL